ncbi:MAG: DinB family protein [Arachidicoccus sp.]|nr:DinB family protein [Arachidicoccus sp.]
MSGKKEVWLRGNKIQGLSPLLQPVADALLQSEEEIEQILSEFPEKLLWEKFAGCASTGFHLMHIRGFLDRLLTYAEGKTLSEEQFNYLNQETVPSNKNIQELIAQLRKSISLAIERLKQIPESTLTEPRSVGRAGLPSTVIGLCIHAAEHTSRHTGQLLVTVKVLSEIYKQPQNNPNL